MTDYTFYDEETGEITSLLSSPIKPSPKNGKYMEGTFDSEKYRIINGSPVKKSDEEIESTEIKKAWIDFRIIRNGKLKDSDYTQLGDSPRNKQAWAKYRQTLRDLPKNISDPRNVTWPEPPV